MKLKKQSTPSLGAPRAASRACVGPVAPCVAPSRPATSAARRRWCAPSAGPPGAGVFFIDTAPQTNDKASKKLLASPAPPSVLGLLPSGQGAAAALAEPPQLKALRPPAPTVLELIQATPSYQRFNELIEARPFLRDDWRSFINRPWVSGLVAAVLSHRGGAEMMQQDPGLAVAVRGVVASVDAALTEEDLAWLVAALDAVDRHTAVYAIMDAAEALVDADAVAWLDGLLRATVTPGRLAATADVAAAVLTPCAVRRRRERRPAAPEAEFVASATRGARWGIEHRKRSAREARRANGPGGGGGNGGGPSSPAPSPPGSRAGSPAASADEAAVMTAPAAAAPSTVPACAVNQLIATLRAFWTPARLGAYLDAVDATLPDAVPALAEAISRAAARPDTRPALLGLFDRVEAAVPARRVAEVGAALVAGATPERAAYVGAVSAQVLPPKRLEWAMARALEALASSEPAPTIHLPAEADLAAAADAAAALAASPRTPEWVDALCDALPPSRLGAWADAVATALPAADSRGRFLRAAADATAPARALAALALRSATDDGRPLSVPAPPPPADLAAAAAVADAALTPAAVAAWAGLADALLTPEHVRAPDDASQHRSKAPPQLPLPPLARTLLLSAVRSGVAARSVAALAGAVGEQGGRAAAVALVDAAAAGAWRERLAAVPAVFRLSWAFHLHLLVGPR